MSGIRPSSVELIELLADAGSFQPWDGDVVSGDPLRFVDTLPYPRRLQEARARAGTSEAVVSGRARCGGHDVVLVAGEFAFVAGTQGVAAGERVIRAFERARELSLPVVGMTNSAGTRMQEGSLAFVQMAAIAAAVERYRAAGGCYIAYLRDPTLGGVLASWGSLAHVTFAAPGALIGLTGPRVVELLAGAPVPGGVMVAEHLLRRGIVDAVVDPRDLRDRVVRVLDVTVRPADPVTPSAGAPARADCADAWTAVERTREPGRAGLRELLAAFATDVTLLRGDGAGSDDEGCVVALARFAGIPVVVVGHDRARDSRGARLGAVGYRKARRGAELAEQLALPLLTVIDTQGAQTSVQSEEGGLAREIARCLATLSRVAVPTLSVLLGEGSGGGALAFLPADRILCSEDAWLAPIAPEGAAAILYRTTEHAPDMAEAQAAGAPDLLRFGIVDVVVAGSRGEALVHCMGAATAAELQRLVERDVAELLAQRQARLRGMGGAGWSDRAL